MFKKVSCPVLTFLLLTLASCMLFSCAKARPSSTPTLEPSGRVGYDALLTLLTNQAVTPEVKAYRARVANQTSTHLMHVLTSCTNDAPNAELPQLTIILDIDEGGVVENARSDSALPLATCVERGWLGKEYDPPPFSPFYQKVTFDRSVRR
jgi:hypothetical protein